MLRLIFDCGGALYGLSFRRFVLIGGQLLDIEDGLADCLGDLWKEGSGEDGGVLFCDRVMGKGVLNGVGVRVIKRRPYNLTVTL